MLDRNTEGISIIGSQRGGMDIEAVATDDPNSIVKIKVPIMGGM